MEYPVLLSALALGSAGWLSGVLLAPRHSGERSLSLALHYAIAAVGALVMVVLLTMPGRGPLHGAAGWGRGFALGGVGALLASYAALRASGGGNPLRWTAAVAAPCFLSLAATSAVLLWMRAAVVETLTGVAAGWFLVSLIVYVGLISSRAQHTGPSGLLQIPLAVLDLGVGFTSTLCATVALGHFRDVAGPQTTRWTTAAIALGAGVPITMLVGAVLAALGRRAVTGSAVEPLWRTLLSGALLTALAYAISTRTLSDPRLLYATGAAVVGVVILWWLLAEGDGGAADVAQAAGRGSIQGNSVLAALLTLGSIVAGFYLLAGYGTGIVLLAAWLPAGVILAAAAAGESSKEMSHADSRETRPAERLVHLLLFGVIVVLYRVFTQRFHDDLTGALLTDHFAIFSIMLGALIPSLLAGALARSAQDGFAAPWRALVRLAFVLVAALALAGGVLILWGAKGAIGLLAGLMLATIIHPGVLAAMLSVGIALPLAQWAHPLLQIAAQTRAEKVRLLLWLAGVVVIALLAADYEDRLAAWTRRRRGRPGMMGVQEGAEM